MGRSRPITVSIDDFRSKRKNASSGAEYVESVTAGEGSKGRKTALYHCNYCNKDITGMVRFKCAQCPDFDLCVECFSVGAEVYPHKSNHPYRVMDNLSFPIICPDWNADEEILLLEGIAIYGFSNWAEVAEHVGTNSKSECIDHYDSAYMNSPCFPLPDLSLAVGKKKEELQAMAKEYDELQKSLEDASRNEERLYSGKMEIEDLQNEASGGLSLQPETGSINTGAAKKPYNVLEVKVGGDDIKVKDTFSDRKVGEKKPKMDEGPSVAELSGYNPKRHEFEVEYDNDAEQLLADMEFHDTDTEAERKLKLKIIKIYNRRLDERERRKNFIIERNLLHPDPFEATLSPEEKEICQRYKVFMRFHSKEDHQELLKTVVEEHRILKKIQDLEEAKAAGCRTSAEAQRFIQQKRKLEAEENAGKMKETIVPGSRGKLILRPGQHRQSGTSSTAPAQPTASSLNDWNVAGFPGADLLSEMDQRLCREIRILPAHYLKMQQTMAMEVLKGNIIKKSDAHRLFQVEPSKVDRVYDVLVKKGIAP